MSDEIEEYISDKIEDRMGAEIEEYLLNNNNNLENNNIRNLIQKKTVNIITNYNFYIAFCKVIKGGSSKSFTNYIGNNGKFNVRKINELVDDNQSINLISGDSYHKSMYSFFYKLYNDIISSAYNDIISSANVSNSSSSLPYLTLYRFLRLPKILDTNDITVSLFPVSCTTNIYFYKNWLPLNESFKNDEYKSILIINVKYSDPHIFLSLIENDFNNDELNILLSNFKNNGSNQEQSEVLFGDYIFKITNVKVIEHDHNPLLNYYIYTCEYLNSVDTPTYLKNYSLEGLSVNDLIINSESIESNFYKYINMCRLNKNNFPNIICNIANKNILEPKPVDKPVSKPSYNGPSDMEILLLQRAARAERLKKNGGSLQQHNDTFYYKYLKIKKKYLLMKKYLI